MFVVNSRQPTIPPLSKRSTKPKSKAPTAKHRSSTDNLFGDSSEEGDSEDLFKPKSAKLKDVDQTSNFSFKSGSAISSDLVTKTEEATKISKKDEDDENDFFKGLSKSQKSTSSHSKTLSDSKNKIVDLKVKKSLFADDDDDDDLFKASSVSSKTKIVSASKKSLPTATKKSLFEDEDDDDLFDDPLKAKNQ